MVAGTKAETVISVIEKIPLKQRNLVKEITLDMAGNMGVNCQEMFSKRKPCHGPFSCSKASYRGFAGD